MKKEAENYDLSQSVCNKTWFVKYKGEIIAGFKHKPDAEMFINAKLNLLVINWISKADRMPDKCSEYDRSNEVLVTDGTNWGYGVYSERRKSWTYMLVGYTEQDDNKITHWADAPILPKSE